jgi:hypothetical protein
MFEIEPHRGSLLKGVGIGVALTVCWAFLGIPTTLGAFSRRGWILLPAEVLLLMIPAWYYYKAGGETETANGIFLLGAIVFLLKCKLRGYDRKRRDLIPRPLTPPTIPKTPEPRGSARGGCVDHLARPDFRDGSMLAPLRREAEVARHV